MTFRGPFVQSSIRQVLVAVVHIYRKLRLLPWLSTGAGPCSQTQCRINPKPLTIIVVATIIIRRRFNSNNNTRKKSNNIAARSLCLQDQLYTLNRLQRWKEHCRVQQTGRFWRRTVTSFNLHMFCAEMGLLPTLQVRLAAKVGTWFRLADTDLQVGGLMYVTFVRGFQGIAGMACYES